MDPRHAGALLVGGSKPPGAASERKAAVVNVLVKRRDLCDHVMYGLERRVQTNLWWSIETS